MYTLVKNFLNFNRCKIKAKLQTPLITLITFIIVFFKLKKNFDQGVHDYDVLVDLVHFSEGGKNANISETRAVLNKPSTDLESATSIT